MAKTKYINGSVNVSVELYHEKRNVFGCYLSDDMGGSGIEVEAQTPEEAAEKLAPYIADYFYNH